MSDELQQRQENSTAKSHLNQHMINTIRLCEKPKYQSKRVIAGVLIIAAGGSLLMASMSVIAFGVLFMPIVLPVLGFQVSLSLVAIGASLVAGFGILFGLCTLMASRPDFMTKRESAPLPPVLQTPGEPQDAEVTKKKPKPDLRKRVLLKRTVAQQNLFADPSTKHLQKSQKPYIIPPICLENLNPT